MKELSYKMFFKAISNETRFNIIQILKRGSASVNEICNKLKYEQSRVSHNLKCLEACGFVFSKRNGKNTIYSLDKKHMLPILTNIDKHIEKYNQRLICCGILKGKKTCSCVNKGEANV